MTTLPQPANLQSPSELLAVVTQFGSTHVTVRPPFIIPELPSFIN